MTFQKFKVVPDLEADFARAAPKPKPRPKKRTPPISLRLNDTELKALRKAAVGRSINGYIRERLFGNAAPIASSNLIAEDYEALARVLGVLGRTDVYTNLAAITLALEQQRLQVSKETEASVKLACKAVTEMRSDLMIALGLRKV